MPEGEEADGDGVLICITCRGRVRFAAGGWVHADAGSTCERLVVAWPPAIAGEERSA
jgi:hypothetical protein